MLWPADRLNLVVYPTQIALTVAYRAHLEMWWAWIAFDVLAIAVTMSVARAAMGVTFQRAAAMRVASMSVLIPLVFTQVGLIVEATAPTDLAAEVAALDDRMFAGVNPLEALEGIAHPVLTELMQWAYILYLPLIPGIILLLAWRGSPEGTARSLWSLQSILFLSYVGYYLCPTSGPNIHSNLGPPGPCDLTPLSLYTFESDLPGVWLKDSFQRWAFAAEVTKWDCMPSAHVGVAIACAVYAFRLDRRWGLALLPLCAAIVFSTVYLRYHYVVDAVAGAALAWFCLVPWERLHRRFAPLSPGCGRAL